MEVWKEVKGFEDYKVSSFGNIKSLKFGKEKILIPSIRCGYYRVELFKNGVGKIKDIHILVSIAFHNHTPNGRVLVVNHKDFDKLNNREDNLEIVTMRENSNQKHFQSSSQYVGVHLNKKNNKWISRIWINGKRKHLGNFNTEIEAHNAYEQALINSPL